LGGEKGVGHGASDQEAVDFGEEVGQDGEFVADFCAAEDGDVGVVGVVEDFLEGFDFGFEEETGGGGEVAGDEGDAGVGAVAGAEGVVDEDFGEGGEGFGEGGLALGLFGMEAEVLQQEDVAGLEVLGEGLDLGADAVGGADDFPAGEFGEALTDGTHAKTFDDLTLGTAEVGHEDDAGVLLVKVANGGKGGFDPGVGADPAFLIQGDVEVHPDEDAPFLNLEIFELLHGKSLLFDLVDLVDLVCCLGTKVYEPSSWAFWIRSTTRLL
jgi:hypothetical protein